MPPSGERALDFRKMSHNFFGLGSTSSREFVLATFISLEDGVFDELAMMMRANVTFFDWHRFLFSMLFQTVFESDLEGVHSWLPLS